VSSVGWSGPNPTLRGLAVFWSQYYGTKYVVDHLLDLFYSFVVHGTEIPSELQRAVFWAVAKYNGTQGWDKLHHLYQKGTKIEGILNGMAGTPIFCTKALALAENLWEDNLIAQLTYASNMLNLNAKCINEAWDWTRQRITYLLEENGASNSSFVADLVQHSFASENLLTEVKEGLDLEWKPYFTAYEAQGILINIQVNIDFVEGLPTSHEPLIIVEVEEHTEELILES